MNLTILADNNVLQSKNFLGEHGLSFYIEVDDKKILFDTGYSDVYLKNASKMAINLLDLDYIVLSHGHYDHTWGLSHYLPFYTSALKQGQSVKKPTILTHPDTFNEKYEEPMGEIGSLLTVEKLKKVFDVNLSKEPFRIAENFIFLGEIPRLNDFEAKESIGEVLKNGNYEDDYVVEDSALVYQSENGLIVITGCSHSGIANIVEYAKIVCNETRILRIIGGFHLIGPVGERINKTVKYLSQLRLHGVYPCHCTNFASKLALSKHMTVKETGVGLFVDYE